MSGELTVGWERAENAAFLPQDSSDVFPPPRLTVGWRPMINAAVLDWSPDDLTVTPGAGPDPTPPTGGPEPVPPGGGGGGGGSGGTGSTPGGGGTSASTQPGAGSAPGAPGAPDIRVTVRRTARLLRRDGLAFEIVAPADATVRAVLFVRTTRKGKVVKRALTATRTTRVDARVRRRLTLRVSRSGRLALIADPTRVATLEVVVTYAGAKPISVRRRVRIVE